MMSNKEEANFLRNLKQGWGKDKGKLPFKCFNYGRFPLNVLSEIFESQLISKDSSGFNFEDE